MELQVKEVTVHDTPSKGTVKEPNKPRRYVVCRNPDQARKDETRAKALGWPEVTFVDQDLGLSRGQWH